MEHLKKDIGFFLILELAVHFILMQYYYKTGHDNGLSFIGMDRYISSFIYWNFLSS